MTTEGEPGRFGLAESVMARVREVLSGFPEIEEAILYGSRAQGTFRPGSDIDLTIRGTAFSAAHLLRLAQSLDDLLLPYTFDLSIFAQIGDPALRAQIERSGRIFFARSP